MYLNAGWSKTADIQIFYVRLAVSRILFAVDLMQQFTVAAYSVSQSQSGSCKKLGNTA